jgi:alpha-D-xyloside xylohydrolase
LHWGGDNSPNFHNIIPQLTGGLSLGLSGFPFWSQDIGGFCGTTDDLLLIRWMQFGMFLSHSRIHGYGDREIYKFSKEAIDHCREIIHLRYRLMPYILGSAKKAAFSSLPMARALVVDYQDDPTTWGIGDEYLFGESLLIAPVFTADGMRRVYLPEGEWTCWWSGACEPGRRWISTMSPLSSIPVYVRAGAVIPMQEVMNFVGEKPIRQLDVIMTPHYRSGARTVFDFEIDGVPASLTDDFEGVTHRLKFTGPEIRMHAKWSSPDFKERIVVEK